MTASDHLKHRTGSLGGDQVSSELSNEQLEHIASNPDAALDYAAEACPEDLQRLAGELLAKRVIYESVSAALAQQTRECEEWRTEHNEQFKAAAQLADGVVRLTDERDALKAQLGRQVAEMEKVKSFIESLREGVFAGSIKGITGRQQREGDEALKLIENLLASRARTK